eukprot:TRINITY_DN1718_c0_g4_i1.p1 TRINITY_DN1718_c0_g4~~TRINITY_DN1718_c0_g4_i1.p1  ORF type:complete len:1012 (-),score=240.99 TRINITY_DN1718_c0_g4_i1:605-3616(-)
MESSTAQKVMDSKAMAVATSMADSLQTAARAKLEAAAKAYAAAKMAAKEKARKFHAATYETYRNMKDATQAAFKNNYSKLVEDDEKVPLFKIVADDDLAKARELEEFKGQRKTIRKRKKIHTVLLLPVALLLGFLAVAYYSYSLIVASKNKIKRYLTHGISLSLYLVLYILIFVGIFAVAPWAVENDSFQSVVGTSLGIFFAIMLSGIAYALWTVRNNALYHAIDYRSSRMRWTFDNILGLIGLFTEFLSLTAFAFPRNIPWDETAMGKATQDALRVFVFDFGVGSFKTSFWLMFGCMLVFFTMVPAIMMLEVYVHYPVERIAASSIVVNLFPVFSDTLFYALINTMFSTIDCTFLPNGTQMYLDADPNILCWEGNHRFFALFSLTALMVYYPTALFYGSYLKVESNGAFGGETLDFKFKPIYYMYEVTIKVILGGVMTFFSTYEKPSLGLMIAVTFLFLALNWYFKPCCLTWVNTWKNAVFLNTAWAALCGLVATASPTAAIIMLYVGWVLLIAVSITLYLRQRRFRASEDSVPQLYTFGRGRRGELGHGGRLNLVQPMRVGFFDLDPRIKSIAASRGASFAVTDDHVYAWGETGLLGLPNVDGLSQDIIEPIAIKPLSHAGVARVIPGHVLAAAVTVQGQLYLWAAEPVATAAEFQGANFEPVLIAGALQGEVVTAVFLGYQAYIFVVTKSDKIFAWGYNTSGVLGLGNESRVVAEPTEVAALSGLGITRIEVKDEYAAAVTSEGRVMTWGNGSYYVLGLGSPEDSLVPTPVQMLQDVTVTDIACAEQYVLALTSEGEVYSWGRYDKINYLEEKEQLGDQEANILDPTLVISFTQRRVVKISACCEEYPVALTDDGILYRIVWKNVHLGDLDNVARQFKEAVHLKNKQQLPTLIIRRLLSSCGPQYRFTDVHASRTCVAATGSLEEAETPLYILYHRQPVVPFDSPEIDDKTYLRPMKRVGVPRVASSGARGQVVVAGHHIMALMPGGSKSAVATVTPAPK